MTLICPKQVEKWNGNECFKSKIDMTIKLLASAFKLLNPDYVLVNNQRISS